MGPFPIPFHNMARSTNNCAIRRDIPVDDHRLRTYTDVITHLDGAQQRRSGPNKDIVTDSGMALSRKMSGPSQSDVMEKHTFIADFRRLADDHTCPMIDEKTTPDLRTGMNFNPAPKSHDDRNQPWYYWNF